MLAERINETVATVKAVAGGDTPVVLAGRFMPQDTRQEFVGTLTAEPGGRIVVRADVRPEAASEIICYIETLGRITGSVSGAHPRGFTIELTGTASGVERIKTRIEWLRQHGTKAAEERKDVRFVPTRKATTLRTGPDAPASDAVIVDVSRSGVSVETDLRPVVESIIYVGRRSARVVRLTETGFAARFALPLSNVGLDESIVL
jgi:hypothetical protein